MRKIRTIALLVILILLIAGSIVFASDTISAMAYCRVPYIINLSDQTKPVTETEAIDQDSVSQTLENIDSLLTEDANTIQQQEEAISEDSQKTEIVNTVCAR